MTEKRKFNRWHTEKQKDTVISGPGIEKKVKILDISAGGMKICLPQPINVGVVIRGEFKIFPHLGPFFVKGKVIRVTEKEGVWEVAIEFEKISTAQV